jgi:HAD superfamily hydrolase (TIGR01490 family)
MKMGFGQIMYVLFGADEDTLLRARDQMLELTDGWHRAEIEQLVEETLDEIADPLVYAEALTLIEEHKRAGRKVYLVSASPEQIVRPIGRHIGVPNIIATRIKTDAAGFFVGEMEQYAMGPGKSEAITALAEAEDIDLDGSYAYSDSVTDLPMMEAVGYPVAVNPEKDLRKVAEEREWPILEFQLPVSMGPRIPKPHPVVSATTITAAVMLAVAAYALLRRRGPV